MIKVTKFYLNRFIDWCYFGKITSKVKSWDGGCESEIEYRGRNNKVVGYWAYGFYDPFFPYPRGLKRVSGNKESKGIRLLLSVLFNLAPSKCVSKNNILVKSKITLPIKGKTND